jgi:hypothetical protein
MTPVGLMMVSCDRSSHFVTFVAFDYALTSNERLNETLAQYESPIIVRSTIEVDGQGASHFISILTSF